MKQNGLNKEKAIQAWNKAPRRRVVEVRDKIKKCGCKLIGATCHHGKDLFYVLEQVAMAIDWDQQNASRFYIGEDAAELVLSQLGFDWGLGVSNKSVEAFIKNKTKHNKT